MSLHPHHFRTWWMQLKIAVAVLLSYRVNWYHLGKYWQPALSSQIRDSECERKGKMGWGTLELLHFSRNIWELISIQLWRLLEKTGHLRVSYMRHEESQDDSMLLTASAVLWPSTSWHACLKEVYLGPKNLNLTLCSWSDKCGRCGPQKIRGVLQCTQMHEAEPTPDTVLPSVHWPTTRSGRQRSNPQRYPYSEFVAFKWKAFAGPGDTDLVGGKFSWLISVGP